MKVPALMLLVFVFTSWAAGVPLSLSETDTAAKLMSIENQITVLVEKDQLQEQEYRRLEGQYKILQEQNQKQNERIKKQEEQIKKQEEQINKLEDIRRENKEIKMDIEKLMAEENMDTLFLATISAETLAISDDEPIIWDSAPINEGGHFNTILGAYTAPYTGYYQFSVTKTSNNNKAHFWLLVDEQRILHHYQVETEDTPTGSTTINIYLTAGQIVRVENNVSSLIYGTNSNGVIFSWFTGFLLYAV